MKRTMLCYFIKGDQVLLAMKKRGFGVGKWNGPGGKCQVGESVEDACRRESVEEVGILPGVLEDRGMIRFLFEEKSEWDTECAIFVCRDFSGDPVETEEMRPQWFPISEIPLADMWEDDPIWLHDVLRGGEVRATFSFDAEGRVLRHDYLPCFP